MTTPFARSPWGERVRQLQRDNVSRDRRMSDIAMVRRGHLDKLFPELFSDTWQKPITANWIDSVAREFAEMIAPLPALSCTSGAMRTEADKKRAAIKNKIGGHYWLKSNLKPKMFSFADAFLTYAFAVFYVEPDYDHQLPMLRTLPSIGTYYRNDRDGNTLELAHITSESVTNLAAKFPEFASQIRTKLDGFGGVALVPGNEKLEVVQYLDKAGWKLFLPARQDLMLAEYANILDYCPARVVERPSLFPSPGGQYDDVIWVQAARARIALLSLEAGTKAVGAPLAVPRDVSELAVGPDAVIVSESPEKIRRVPIDLPNAAFALQETLESELRMGARYPEGRAGGIDASVITGRGVQALMGSFDTQISVAQAVIGEGLSRATEMCFELDVKVWPSTKKRITGSSNGEAYDFSYVPETAINDIYACEVTYGFAAGLAPNAAAVMLLQLRGDRLIDRDTVRRNLPFSIDPEQMQRNMDVEETSDALKAGLAGLLQGAPQLAAQGMDPRPFLRAAATIVKGRADGKPLEDLFIEAFAPETMNPPSAQPPDQQDQGQPQPPGQEATPAAAGPGGAPPGAPPAGGAPTLPQQGQQQMPDIQSLIAGMRGGRPQFDASVRRQIPA